jgi:hypothetical protein
MQINLIKCEKRGSVIQILVTTSSLNRAFIGEIRIL